MLEIESVKQEPQFAAFIGIDWADQKHVWCMQAVGSEKRESGELCTLRKRWRGWSVNCANDSPIVPSPWRWSKHGELWHSC